MSPMGVHITCRVSDPNSDVILRSISSGEEVPAFFDNKMGFFGNLPPGQYQCETTVNGQIGKSAIYTVKPEGELGQTSPLYVYEIRVCECECVCVCVVCLYMLTLW